MENYQNRDVLQAPKKLPDMLNVLTILTFIGCGLAYIMGVYGFFSSADPDRQVAELEEQMEKAGDNEMMRSMMQSSIDMVQKSYEYRYEMLISTLLFTTLCLIGAIQMRKLKRSGFYIYTIGELAPLLVSVILIGLSFFGGIMLAIGAIIAFLFVILYATQLKHLK